MRSDKEIFVLTALAIACASNEKLFAVRGELTWGKVPLVVRECGNDAIYDIVMSSDLYRDLRQRADALASTSSSPIIVRLRGTVTLDLTAAMVRKSVPRLKMSVHYIDLIEQASAIDAA